MKSVPSSCRDERSDDRRGRGRPAHRRPGRALPARQRGAGRQPPADPGRGLGGGLVRRRAHDRRPRRPVAQEAGPRPSAGHGVGGRLPARMTRRLTLTMVAVVTAALLVATIGTLVVTRVEARVQARRDLGAQAQRLARRIETVQRVGLATVQVALRLEDGGVLCFGQTCRAPGAIPAGLTEADLRLPRLQGGQLVTGTHGSLAFAAAPAPRGENLMVVVLTRRLQPTRGVLGPWFFVIVALTLLAAVAVAANL